MSLVFSLGIALLLVAADPVLPRTASTRLDTIEAQIKSHENELAQTRARLEGLREHIAKLDTSAKTSLARIEALREQVAVARRYISQLTKEFEDRTAEIAVVTNRIDETASSIKTRKRDLARRLTSIYKYGLTLELEAILSTRSLPEVYRKAFFLRRIARADKRKAQELAELNRLLAAERTRLFSARADLERLKDERLAEQERLAASEATESSLLEKVRSERQAKSELEKQLDAAADRLQRLIADLEREREKELAPADSHYFVLNRGKLPWPASGEVLARYGSQVHPVYKTKTFNRGIDIRTKPGTPVVAIGSGQAAYADQFMGYGRLVIIDHGAGFYTLYSNLEAVSAAVGAAIAAGSQVGTSKDHVHFEVRRHGKPVDPLEWLAPTPSPGP